MESIKSKRDRIIYLNLIFNWGTQALYKEIHILVATGSIKVFEILSMLNKFATKYFKLWVVFQYRYVGQWFQML